MLRWKNISSSENLFVESELRDSNFNLIVYERAKSSSRCFSLSLFGRRERETILCTNARSLTRSLKGPAIARLMTEPDRTRSGAAPFASSAPLHATVVAFSLAFSLCTCITIRQGVASAEVRRENSVGNIFSRDEFDKYLLISWKSSIGDSMIICKNFYFHHI